MLKQSTGRFDKSKEGTTDDLDENVDQNKDDQIVIEDSPVPDEVLLSNDQDFDNKRNSETTNDRDVEILDDDGDNEAIRNLQDQDLEMPQNDGDESLGYDQPFYGDDDMFFMDDGGSFVLEMPPGTNSQKNDSLKSNESKRSLSTSLKTNKTIENTTINSIENNFENEIELHASGIQPDSFNVSELKEIDEKLTSTTPMSDKHVGKNLMKTPMNPSLKRCKEDSFNDSFETPPPKPKDKDGCKNFQPGCSTHPETKEAITPMPNFAQYPTPELKVHLFIVMAC